MYAILWQQSDCSELRLFPLFPCPAFPLGNCAVCTRPAINHSQGLEADPNFEAKPRAGTRRREGVSALGPGLRCGAERVRG